MRREWSIYTMVWTAIVAMYAAALLANGVPAGFAARNAIANLLPDALLGIAILRLRPSNDRLIATHVVRVIAFVAMAFAGWAALVALDSLLFSGTVSVQMNVRVLPFKIIYDVLIYLALAAVAGVREQSERAVKAEALRAEAVREAMRSQLNPHFILNTFHALVGLVRRDPQLAESGLERLGDLLRYSQRVQREKIDEITLREELAFVQTYLDLEQLRLGDRLRVRIDAPAPALEHLVPTFSVQTLVENAVRHAIAPRAGGGEVSIDARQVNGHMRISVRDQASGDVVQREATNGTGLRLLHDRLAALYGDAGSVALESVDGGTCARLEIPARLAAEVEQ